MGKIIKIMLEKIPKSENLEFKEKFIERYSKLTNFKEFKKYSLSYLRKSIRVNTLKISVNKLKKRLLKLKLKQIPWCKEGFWVNVTKDLGNLIEHTLGYFYVQEAASMIPAIVLNPKKTDLILDMCAAPGSKTTHLANLMNNSGLIVANDSNFKRIKALAINLQRCGICNTIISLMDASNIKNLKFDKILLDAPCSGTGTIRKSLGTIQIWNENKIKKFANVQKKLILNAYDNLKGNGTLVYSTCSLEPEENEEVVDFLLKNRKCKLEDIKIDIKKSKPILKFNNKKYSPEIKKCLRLWPQNNDTEGFFVVKIKKI